ncbi:MAG: class I SAM-dependent methyltransferase [Anaerolineales bacterium]|nr:class I SAM-dependent methyltransferase [Anaerolineales bacterium]
MNEIYYSGDLYDRMIGDYSDDIPFYIEESKKAKQPVLELACGAGRVLIPVAEAGISIWGVDAAPGMLDHARFKIANLPEDVKNRISLRQADMREFDLEERFGLVMIPFRSFLHLLTMEDQMAALTNIRRHLMPDGKLALNFFQPSLPIIAAHMSHTGAALKYLKEWIDPDTNNRVVCWETRNYYSATQIVQEQRIFEQVDAAGRVVDRYYRSFSLRWIYRYEFEHLLKRTGFEILELYGGLDRSPFDEQSQEMVWIAQRDG